MIENSPATQNFLCVLDAIARKYNLYPTAQNVAGSPEAATVGSVAAPIEQSKGAATAPRSTFAGPTLEASASVIITAPVPCWVPSGESELVAPSLHKKAARATNAAA